MLGEGVRGPGRTISVTVSKSELLQASISSSVKTSEWTESSEPHMTFSEMEKLKTLQVPQRKAGVLNFDAYWKQLGSSQNYPIPRPQPRMITKESERGGGRQASVLMKLSR